MIDDKKYNLFLLAASLLSSCSIEPDLDKLPIIQPELGFSIYQESITLNDVDILTGDSSITKESYGLSDSIFVFNKTVNIEKQEVGDKLSIEDINKQFSQNVDNVTIEDSEVEEKIGFDPVGIDAVENKVVSEVGLITLDNIEPQSTEPYLFSSIYPSVSDIPNGNTVTIPSFDLEPVTNSFSFNDFSEAAFNSGSLSITIINNLVIPLGDVDIKLKKSDGSEIAGGTTTIQGPINSSSQQSALLDLSGLTLPGNIIVEVTGSSPGESNVLINEAAKISSFSVEISGSGLEVTSANAKIPAQTISESSSISLAADSNKVVLATISGGKLSIDIDNYMSVASNMILSIPSLKAANGNNFQTNINISANSENILNESDISGYTLSMAIDNQSVIYSYDVTTNDSGDDFVEIKSIDSIIVNIVLEGSVEGQQLLFSNFEGMVTPQDLGFEGEINIESDSDILEANLNSGSLILDVANSINTSSEGAPTAVITINEIINASSNEPLVINTGAMFGVLDPIEVDLNGYKIVMPRDSQSLNYTADVQTVYEVGTYSLLDSMDIDITVTGLGFSTVRGFFAQDAMSDSNSISLDDSTIVHNALLKSGELSLSINNSIGVVADVFFQITEFYKNSISLDTTFTINSGISEVQIDLSGYNLILPSDVDTQKVNYVSNISLPSDQEMTLSLSDSISISVNMTDMAFQSVTGQINPVFIDIDPVEQTIDALPEELDGFDFNDVEMFLDFNSSIDLPVYLNLSITAYNDTNGDSITRMVNQNIHANPNIEISNASELINIRPDRIVARGSAKVGDLDSVGTVASDDSLSGVMSVRAPLMFLVDDGALISPDPVEFVKQGDSLGIPDEIIDAALVMTINNQWEFGASVSVLLGPDSLAIENGEVDTLLSGFTFSPDASIVDTIYLDEDAFQLLKRSPSWIQPQISVISNEGTPVKFLSTDTLKITIDGLSSSIDLSTLAGEE
ncbi:hypothetical protein N9W06_03590 [Candidatus Marinimicrobia bacterium]|nr:hypothetical protein [Candidatus Neomarinimicrobiota bacterium]